VIIYIVGSGIIPAHFPLDPGQLVRERPGGRDTPRSTKPNKKKKSRSQKTNTTLGKEKKKRV